MLAIGIKASPLNSKFIPLICGALGGALGTVGMLIVPNFPAQDYLGAVALGIVSGLAATGINQIYKQFSSNHETLKKKYPIWLAQYYKEAQLECDIWQYSSNGTVPGISGSVDMNIIYDDDIIDNGNKNPQSSIPTTEPADDKSFKVKVTAAAGLNCRKGAGTELKLFLPTLFSRL